jgi:hypothetical protein
MVNWRIDTHKQNLKDQGFPRREGESDKKRLTLWGEPEDASQSHTEYLLYFFIVGQLCTGRSLSAVVLCRANLVETRVDYIYLGQRMGCQKEEHR